MPENPKKTCSVLNRRARPKFQQLDPKRVLGLKQGVLKNMLQRLIQKDLGCLTLGRNQVQGCCTNPQLGTVAPNPIMGLILSFPQGRLEQLNPNWARGLRSSTFLGPCVKVLF